MDQWTKCMDRMYGPMDQMGEWTPPPRLSAVNLENIHAAILRGVGELNLTIDAPGAKERAVEDVEPVRRHDHLDLVARLESESSVHVSLARSFVRSLDSCKRCFHVSLARSFVHSLDSCKRRFTVVHKRTCFVYYTVGIKVDRCWW